MVEAAIYFPVTIAVVMAVIYFGLFKLQESYFFYQVERAASELSREIAYPGYESFTEDEPMKNSQVDFAWEDGPTENQVKSYYTSYKGTASKIYRWGLDSEAKNRAAAYQKALEKNSALFSLGRTEAFVSVDNSLLTKSVKVQVRYVLPTPGILRYLGVKKELSIGGAAYQPVLNTTDFVRNTDLAFDMANFLLKKLGLEEQKEKFLEAFDKIKTLIF